MKLFRDLSIAAKVLIPPVILVLALGGVTLLAIYGMTTQQRTLDALHNVTLDKITMLDEFALISEQVQSDVFQIAVLRYIDLPEAEIEAVQARLERGLNDLDVIYGQILTRWSPDATEQTLLAQLKESMDAFRLQALQAAEVISDNPSFGVLFVRSAATSFSELSSTVEEFLDYEKAEILLAEEESNRNASLVGRVIVTITISVAVTVVVITVLTSVRLISHPIRSMTELMRRLAEGELNIETGDVERQDEIGAMARALEVFRANAVLRARAEEALRESMQTSDDIIQAMPSGLFTYQYEPPNRMILLDSNPEAEALTGISAREWRGRELNEILPEARESGVTDAFLNVLHTGETYATESLLYEDERIAGTFRIRAFRMPKDKLGVAFEDVTERRLMEAQLEEYTQQLEHLVEDKVRELDEERAKVIQAGKMAALGQLATGIAHELNQPLTAILLDGEYLRRLGQSPDGEQSDAPLPEASELRRIGEDIVMDVTRCTRIIDHLRTFSRAEPLEPIRTSLNQPIQESFILVGQRLREHGVDVQLSLASELPPIMADPHRLEQVFLNLISNAEHALAEMERRVETGEVESDGYQKELEISTRVEEDTVVAVVRDNGCGMSAADQEHIFEPFFTTKPVGEGTGIGLSISYGIVADFGGEISFDSAENAGTTFWLSFPVAEP